MHFKQFAVAAMLAGGLIASPAAAGAQRAGAQADPDRALPLCRVAEAGERCRTRNGTIRVRRDARPAGGHTAGQTNNLGGGDPGWELRDPRSTTDAEAGQTNNLGGGDPGWELRDPRSTTDAEAGQTNNLGGGDPGWELRGEAGNKTDGQVSGGQPDQG